MKLKNYLSLSLLISLLGITSCSEDSELMYSQVDTDANNAVEYYTLHVIYQGESYYSQCRIEGDSTFILDERMRNLLSELELMIIVLLHITIPLLNITIVRRNY